jgi:hypothetical protein
MSQDKITSMEKNAHNTCSVECTHRQVHTFVQPLKSPFVSWEEEDLLGEPQWSTPGLLMVCG